MKQVSNKEFLQRRIQDESIALSSELELVEFLLNAPSTEYFKSQLQIHSENANKYQRNIYEYQKQLRA